MSQTLREGKRLKAEGMQLMKQTLEHGSGDEGGLDLTDVLQYLNKDRFEFEMYVKETYPEIDLKQAISQLKPYLRHGDVLLKRHTTPEAIASVRKTIAEECNEIKNWDGIVKHGTGAGHSHRVLHPENVMVWESVEGKRYYEIMQPTILVHEEHIKMLMPATSTGMGMLEQMQEKELNPIENAIVEVMD